MPDVDDAVADDPQPGDDAGRLYSSAAARRLQRRKQAAVAGVGLVAMLGAGIFVVDQIGGGGDRTTVDAGPLAPLAADPVTTPTPTSAAAGARSAGAAATAGRMPRSASVAASAPTRSSPTGPVVTEPSTTADEIRTAQEATAGDGLPVRRPLSPPPSRAAVAAASVKVVETGSLKTDGRTMRIVSARQDLTGQRELAWVADGGEPVGDARCSQTIRLSEDLEPATRPNLLVCWRTSAAKSVYTVAVDLSGHPSSEASVAVIDRVWSELS